MAFLLGLHIIWFVVVVFILLSPRMFIINFAGGLGSNSRAQVIAIWVLLYCVRWLHMDSVYYAFGDSRVTID